jgi:hypothetical protein
MSQLKIISFIKHSLRFIYSKINAVFRVFNYTMNFRDPLFLRGFSLSRISSSSYLNGVINTLRPREVGIPLIRVGNSSDGGYLLPDDLGEISHCLSAGCDKLWEFERVLNENFGVPSHIIDSNDKKPHDLPMNFTYTSKWLGGRSTLNLVTLEEWVESVSPISEELILQMDIEGSEWEVLGNAPDDLLQRFRILVIEFHRIPNLFNQRILEKYYGPLLERIDRSFQAVHFHPNNSCGFTSFGGISIPNAFEVTYLRRDRFVKTLDFTRLPHPLDRPNDPTAPEISFVWDFHKALLE